uniref:Uncharacterized protein n=1 Tax=Populus trichocarpa TaxID=3694 RepID=A0A2K2A9T1_POPTR
MDNLTDILDLCGRPWMVSGFESVCQESSCIPTFFWQGVPGLRSYNFQKPQPSLFFAAYISSPWFKQQREDVRN